MCKIIVCSFFVVLTFLTSAYALPQAKLGKTTIIGRDVSDGVEFFGGEHSSLRYWLKASANYCSGIPFAEPPLGPLRLSRTVLKTRLDTPTFNASAYGKSCIQPVRIDGFRDQRLQGRGLC